MNYVYLYAKKEVNENYLKYGIKLSEVSDSIINVNGYDKKGIVCYLNPKDSSLYSSPNFICLKIMVSGLSCYVVNEALKGTNYYSETTKTLINYNSGDYEIPIAVVCSTILPENISVYNKVLDTPLLYDNSKDLYYEKNILDIIENNKTQKKDILKLLLESLSGIEILENDKKSSRIYLDTKTNKKYTAS